MLVWYHMLSVGLAQQSQYYVEFKVIFYESKNSLDKCLIIRTSKMHPFIIIPNVILVLLIVCLIFQKCILCLYKSMRSEIQSHFAWKQKTIRQISHHQNVQNTFIYHYLQCHTYSCYSLSNIPYMHIFDMDISMSSEIQSKYL